MTGLRSLRRLGRPAVLIPIAVIVLLVGLRLALPFLLTRYLNNMLAELPAYAGSIDDVDVHLWRGAYSIHGIEVHQIKNGKVSPLFNGKDIDLSVQWNELLHGRLVGQMALTRPQLNIVAVPARSDVKEQKFRIQDLVDRFTQFMPLKINRFDVTQGELHFGDQSTSPPLDVFFDQIELTAHNLTNAESVSNDLWATVEGTARLMVSGQVKLDMRLNPTESRPTFDFALALSNLRLTALNDYLRHYLAVEAHDGSLSLYTEATARNGKFRGYVKPIVKNLDILQIKKEPESIGETVKGFFVKILAHVFKNEPQQQLATKIEFAGSFEDPQIGEWDAVVYFIRNAFVQALAPGLEATVAPRQAKEAQQASGPNRQQRQPKRQR